MVGVGVGVTVGGGVVGVGDGVGDGVGVTCFGGMARDGVVVDTIKITLYKSIETNPKPNNILKTFFIVLPMSSPTFVLEFDF
ncbi:MAG: hypothetical protein ACRENW_04435 [Thermodesulfobacteriota bacterium]